MINIAIVEDEKLYVSQLKEYISRYEKESGNRINVRVFPDGAEIVENYSGDFDIILMDIQMPVMNGYEATEQIRALEDPALAKIRILAMTANAFDEDRKQALKCGMDGFLSKPIVMEELIRTLQNNMM